MILVIGDVLDRLEVSPVAGAELRADAIAASVRSEPAGRAADTAAWLGESAAAVRLLGRVGAGEADRHRAALARHGVEAFLSEDPEHRTGISIDINGQRYDDPGATANLTPADIPPGLLDSVDWLHLTTELLAYPTSRATALALLAEARERQIGTSVDPGSAAVLRHLGVETFTQWTRGIDLVLPNLDEARLLVGATGPFIDFETLTKAYPHAAVTLGSMGAAYVSAAHREQVAAPRIEVADHHGSGAAFVAGFLAAWVPRRDPHEALTSGVAVAQRCLQRAGSRP